MAETLRTACNRDCPDACSLLVTVEDGRATALRGDPDDPMTRGFLCPRTKRFLRRQYAPDRLTTPLVRKDGRLVPLGWDAALDLAAERLLAIREASGPAAILHYRSGGSLGLLKVLADHLFEQFGPVTMKHGDICSGAGEAAQVADFGLSESSDLADLLHARLILCWGKNPHTSGVHLVPVLKEALRRGAVMVGIDPVRTRMAGLCELFLQPRPGADYAVAMGVARQLLDAGGLAPDAAGRCRDLPAFQALAMEHDLAGWAREADVPVEDLRRLAGLYAEVRPSTILVGWGLGRRRNGAATVRALDALGAISGNLGRPGAGVSYQFARRAPFDTGFVRGLEVAPRSLPEALLGRAILEATDPPVRAVWITAGNPVSMLPDSATVRRALQSREFVVVVDTHPSDTTDVADLVLPTLTLLEDSDLLGSYGSHWLRESRPVVAPPGGLALDGAGRGTDDEGPRHELAVLQGLAARLGVGEALAGTVEDWKRRLSGRLQRAGAGLDAMRREGWVRSPFAAPVLFEGGKVATPDGRVRLMTERAAPAPVLEADWPLLLLAVSTPEAQSSQWSVPLDGPPRVSVHPSAAAGLPDGARARLESRHASLEVRVRHDPGVRPDVALMGKGGQLRDGACPNLLVAAMETDLGGGAAYYDEPVRLVPA